MRRRMSDRCDKFKGGSVQETMMTLVNLCDINEIGCPAGNTNQPRAPGDVSHFGKVGYVLLRKIFCRRRRFGEAGEVL